MNDIYIHIRILTYNLYGRVVDGLDDVITDVATKIFGYMSRVFTPS